MRKRGSTKTETILHTDGDINMYKINQHLPIKKDKSIKISQLKYLNAQNLEREPNGFYCKKWGDDYIIETTISDAEIIRKLIITAVSYVMVYKKPFVIYY